MDITKIGTKNSDNVTAITDKKIVLKHFKDDRAWRTYIYGLHNFMDLEKAKAITQIIKKTGTSLYIRYNEITNMPEYGFNGQHIDSITKILIEKGKIPKECIVY
jgi:hypothetical protein